MPVEPAIIIIFGITGDLASRKLLPALYHLLKDDLLNDYTVILGISRHELGSAKVLENVNLCVNETDGVCDPTVVNKLSNILQTHTMDTESAEAYQSLKQKLDEIEAKAGVCMNRLYYLAIPPTTYADVIDKLGQAGHNASCQHGQAKSRLLVEKPFGYDLPSAQKLIDESQAAYKDDQIFRIDHFVAKETVQNILTFRKNNPLFQSVWDGQYIESIQITAAEKIGIEGRSSFYEQMGALRDVTQSHLMQLLAIVGLDLPDDLSGEKIHQAKLEFLNSVSTPSPDEARSLAARGQYDSYKQEVKNPKSQVETFAAIALKVDNDKWQNTAILIRTGKALVQPSTKVAVAFKPSGNAIGRDLLTFSISPDEGIIFDSQTQSAPMDFSYQRTFEKHNGHPDAYERVVVDAIRGDHSLFTSGPEVLASWRILQPILDFWKQTGDGLEIYPTGSSGPKNAEALAEKLGTKWI